MLTYFRKSVGSLLAKLFRERTLTQVELLCSQAGIKSKLLLFALQYSLAFDPLKSAEAPKIQVLIPVSGKDVDLAMLAAASVVRHSRNPITKVTFAAPESVCPDLEVKSSELRQWVEESGSTTAIEIANEAAILEPHRRALSSLDGSGKGWVIQQILKLEFASRAGSPVLILDADTVLTKTRTFLGPSGKQLLAVGTDAHRDYHRHLWVLLGKHRLSPLSFVTHHQLMQSDVLLGGLAECGVSLEDWLELGMRLGREGGFSASEFQTYGELLLEAGPSRYQVASWGNRNATQQEFEVIKRPLGDALNWLIRASGDSVGSISFHWYLMSSERR